MLHPRELACLRGVFADEIGPVTAPTEEPLVSPDFADLGMISSSGPARNRGSLGSFAAEELRRGRITVREGHHDGQRD